MEATKRIEQALMAAVARAEGPGCPPLLGKALRHAVFPGGARVRPRLCLAIAFACGEDDPGLTDAAASAIELLHCASLVHDDLPCFDDAATRRGKASVHRAYGERLAVLAGDALIVMAFETLVRASSAHPERLGSLVLTVSRSVGAPVGIAAGQAWECEAHVPLEDYQRQKTGSLFCAAAVAGAQCAGAEPGPWRRLGEHLGEAYQVADDIRDVVADPQLLGKPQNQDATHGCPSRVAELGLDGAVRCFEDLLAQAVASIPPCPGEALLRGLIEMESVRLIPKGLVRRAA